MLCRTDKIGLRLQHHRSHETRAVWLASGSPCAHFTFVQPAGRMLSFAHAVSLWSLLRCLLDWKYRSALGCDCTQLTSMFRLISFFFCFVLRKSSQTCCQRKQSRFGLRLSLLRHKVLVWVWEAILRNASKTMMRVKFSKSTPPEATIYGFRTDTPVIFHDSTVPPFKPLWDNTVVAASWLSCRGVPSATAAAASGSCRLSSSTMCSLSSSSESELASKPLLKFVTAGNRETGKMKRDVMRSARGFFKRWQLHLAPLVLINERPSAHRCNQCLIYVGDAE